MLKIALRFKQTNHTNLYKSLTKKSSNKNRQRIRNKNQEDHLRSRLKMVASFNQRELESVRKTWRTTTKKRAKKEQGKPPSLNGVSKMEAKGKGLREKEALVTKEEETVRNRKRNLKFKVSFNLKGPLCSHYKEEYHGHLSN